MQTRKILPGLFIGLLFIGAFVFGLNSFGATNAVSKTSITQPAPSGETGAVAPSDPALVAGEGSIVVTTPADVQPVEVANQTPEAAPAVEKTQPAEPTRNPEKEEQNSKEKEGEDND
jgi:hypothetical protein